MKEAELHQAERERLKALIDYDVLDTEAEENFDELTQLASEICETPISLISLIDPDRQWFKSKVGIGAESTPRSIAFCSHAILQEDVFEITNALQDERFHDNPLVTEDPNIRFYAGAPLITPDGYPIGTLCVISDKPKKLTTHQKNALIILARQIITQLELRTKTRKLEQASEYKTEFLSNISHEIRTPLNAIVGFSDLLNEHADEHLCSDKGREYASNIDYSGHHLLSIVNSILDINKIEVGKMELQIHQFELANFMKNVTNMLVAKAEQASISLNLDITSIDQNDICLDENKLSQIVINLLGNAIKFTPAHKAIHLYATSKDNLLTIEVKDEGIGIKPDEVADIFDKYKQVGNKTSHGTGLGLSITKGLVELMSGDIKIESEYGKGTQAVVTIPFTQGCEEKSAPLKESESLSGMSVLVVEDNPINQKLIEAMLNNLTAHSVVVTTGEDALAYQSLTEFDVVLMDINLPGIDGFETTAGLKKLGVTAPVIALTADVFIDSSKHNIFDDYLTKPVTKQQLHKSLSHYLPISKVKIKEPVL